MGKAQFANPSMMALSAMGEVSEYIQENVVYGINKLPGGEYVLSTIGSIIGPIVNTTHNILGGVGNLILSDAQVEYLKQKYTELPHGMQVLGRDILDIATLSAAGKVAGSTLKVMATPQEVVRNTKYINVTPDMLYKHPEPLKPHPKQAYVPPIVLTDVEYIDLTKPALTVSETLLVENPIDSMLKDVIGKAPYKGGATELAALEMKIASKVQSVTIAGPSHTQPIWDINRITTQYGGTSADWVKKSTVELNTRRIFHSGASLQFHWYENIKTGAKVEYKLKIQ